jgi:hypothetical protein
MTQQERERDGLGPYVRCGSDVLLRSQRFTTHQTTKAALSV